MRAVFCAVLLGSAACASDAPVTPEPPSFGDPKTSRGLSACLDDSIDGAHREGWRCVTHRAVSGISMGGGSAMRIGLDHPELFDVVGSLGSPYIDIEFFLLSVSAVSNGGFCPREQLLANLASIDEKDSPNTWCGPNTIDELALPESECAGFSGDFNHHYRGPDAGRGGSFNREGSFQIVQDFALAYGNPAHYNPDSPYLAPGVPLSHHVALELDAEDRRAERAAKRREICDNPIRQMGFYDRDWNPTAEFPVITFCDGNGPTNGEYEPGLNNFPVEVVLAVDYNDNGRRDYGEPTVAQPFERYDDLGEDGLASEDEPGYDPVSNPDPAGDDYHWRDNPSGPEGNNRWEASESFSDDGLDGVPNTGDFGEGTGVWDLNPNVENAFQHSPRRAVENIAPRMFDRLHIWADAGIRDFLFSPQITNQFWGALSQRTQDQRVHRDWSGLAAAGGLSGAYDPYLVDLSPEAVGRSAYLWYGDASICPGVDEAEGRGNHVGPAWEVLDRLLTMFAFASQRWEEGDRSLIPGSLSEQGSPNGSLSDFVLIDAFESTALGRSQPFTVVLPPDYYQDTETRYPVIYFLHGQGQKASDFAASALLFLGPQMDSQDDSTRAAGKADWQKMIIVFSDAECRPGECHTGTFSVDFQGVQGQGLDHEEAFFELMRHIDAQFRTKPAEMIPVEGTE